MRYYDSANTLLNFNLWHDYVFVDAKKITNDQNQRIKVVVLVRNVGEHLSVKIDK